MILLTKAIKFFKANIVFGSLRINAIKNIVPNKTITYVKFLFRIKSKIFNDKSVMQWSIEKISM